MAEASEQLTHPILGALRWLPKFSHWFVQLPLPPGGQLDVIVYPGNGDRFEFLPRAAELFQWAMANERRALTDAIQTELLELFNDNWRDEDEPALTEDELVERLEWQLLRISTVVPVEFSYEAGELFGYHGVTVMVDAELRFRRIELRG